MPYQVVDEKSVARHAQRFVGEGNDLPGFQMVEKERASHNIETVVREGQGQCVSTHGRVSAVEMTRSAVEQHRLESNAAPSGKIAGQSSDISRSSDYIQKRNCCQT